MINTTESKFHELLNGINDYESIQTYSPMYKKLRGYIRDIDLVLGSLEHTLKIPEGQPAVLMGMPSNQAIQSLDNASSKLAQALDMELLQEDGTAFDINNLLTPIGVDLDNAPNVTRAATVVVDPRQEWVTKQIQIVVKR